ncbi:MAG: hypothetical protein RML49_02635 [Verrucomicrobiae bacterium]|nr:hypothetical protein [Verrucomicrobiae bacterium]
MKRWLMFAGVIFGVLGVGIPLVCYWAVLRFVEGPLLTKWLESRIAEMTGGETTVMPLEWKGFAAYSEGIEVRGGEGLKRARLDQWRGEVNARALFWERVWRLQGLEAQRLLIELADQSDGQGERTERRDGEGSFTFDQVPWWLWWLPTRLEWGSALIREVEMLWPIGKGMRGELKGMTVTLRPRDGGWDVLGRGGKLRAGEFPQVRVVELRGRLREPYFFITEGRWQSEEGGGEGLVTGELALDGERSSRLNIQAKDVPIRDVVGGDWRARFHGKVEGHVDLMREEKQKAADGRWKGVGKLLVREGMIEGLPWLETWARYTGLDEYRRLRLTTAEADVIVDEGGGVIFRNIRLESSGVVRVEGRVSVKEAKVEGELEVGLTDGQVRLIPAGKERIFTRNAEGYLWAVPPMRVYGTVNDVQEDLSGRVGSAVVDEVQRKIESGAEKILERVRSLF